MLTVKPVSVNIAGHTITYRQTSPNEWQWKVPGTELQGAAITHEYAIKSAIDALKAPRHEFKHGDFTTSYQMVDDGYYWELRWCNRFLDGDFADDLVSATTIAGLALVAFRKVQGF